MENSAFHWNQVEMPLDSNGMPVDSSEFPLDSSENSAFQWNSYLISLDYQWKILHSTGIKWKFNWNQVECQWIPVEFPPGIPLD